MVHFTRSGPAALSSSRARCAPRGARVTPFGCPRIKGHVLLPAAFRSLSRPSSPCGSTGIRHGPTSRLTILPRPRSYRGGRLVLFIAPSLPSCCQTSVRASRGSMGQNRVELLTPALSERCSNQLSYCPPAFHGAGTEGRPGRTRAPGTPGRCPLLSERR